MYLTLLYFASVFKDLAGKTYLGSLSDTLSRYLAILYNLLYAFLKLILYIDTKKNIYVMLFYILYFVLYFKYSLPMDKLKICL